MTIGAAMPAARSSIPSWSVATPSMATPRLDGVTRDLDRAVSVRVRLHDEENPPRAADGGADRGQVPAEAIEIDFDPGGEFHVVRRSPAHDEYHAAHAEASAPRGHRPTSA